jgi:hypothetical protein
MSEKRHQPEHEHDQPPVFNDATINYMTFGIGGTRIVDPPIHVDQGVNEATYEATYAYKNGTLTLNLGKKVAPAIDGAIQFVEIAGTTTELRNPIPFSSPANGKVYVTFEIPGSLGVPMTSGPVGSVNGGG